MSFKCYYHLHREVQHSYKFTNSVYETPILFKVEAEVMNGDEDSEGWMEHKSPDQSNIEKMTHES